MLRFGVNSKDSFAAVVLIAAIVGVVPIACGKSTKRDSNGAGAASGKGGSESAGSGGSSAGDGGGAGTDAGSGGLTSAGRSPSDGGASGEAGGDAGMTAAGSGGMAVMGGATSTTGGSAGQDGGSAQAGSGSAGSPGTGGASTCSACELHESCWLDGPQARCIATPVPVPIGLAIDATEVTRAQYAGWLAAGPTTAGRAEVCAWNDDFAPDAECMAQPSVCHGDACENHPQPCIDMCDAAAYCAEVGARLCTSAEWTSACSSDGMYPSAYGETFVAGTCNDYTVFSETTVPVASKAGCQAPADSGFAGVFDLIGNIAEWVDDCTSAEGAADVCKPRGLSFGIGAAAPLCSQSTYAARSMVYDNLGFRCCSAGQ